MLAHDRRLEPLRGGVRHVALTGSRRGMVALPVDVAAATGAVPFAIVRNR